MIFSAADHGTAFGSLWLSGHPGTSSMGELMALALVCTMTAAVLFQPALMGPPRDRRAGAPPPVRRLPAAFQDEPARLGGRLARRAARPAAFGDPAASPRTAREREHETVSDGYRR